MAEDLHEIKGVEIFATGTHNGDLYKMDDLEDMVSSFGKVGFNVPLKQGHYMESGAVALGWVEKLRIEGKKLVADFVSMPTEVFDTIKRRGFDTVSSEIFFDLTRGGKFFRRVLKAVALLGVEVPGVSSLKPLREVEFSEKGDVFKTYEFKQKENDQMDIDALKAEIKTLTAERDGLQGVNQRADFTVKIEKIQADIISGFSEAQTKSTETIKNLTTDLEGQRKDTAEIKAKLFADKVEKQANSLKVPALRPFFSALYSMASTKVVKFSANGGEKKDTDQEAVLDELVSVVNKQAEKLFGQNAFSENERTEGVDLENPRDEVDRLTKEYMDKNKIKDYSEAMAKVLEADQDLRVAYAAS